MPTRSFLWSIRSLAVFSIVSPSIADRSAKSSGSYQLHESWQGEKFLDYFNFFDGADPTHGFVTYLNQSTAEGSGLIDVTSSGSFYMGVDYKKTLVPEGPGRESVRIESKQYYDEGLYIVDLAHMPGSACGTWPAFWSVGPDWPHDGEIDIIEGVNKHEANEIVLHTSGSCNVGGGHEMHGDMTSSECGEASGTVGCVVKGTQGSSGDPFNKNGGGVYAMEWTADFLKIWYFPRDSIPESITDGEPDPSAFGTPMAHLQGSCDFHKRFKSQKFILDTTFCGDWAGGVYGDSGCPVSDPSKPIQSCVKYVAENPDAFKEAYWEINSIKIYQIGDNSNGPAQSASTHVDSATVIQPTRSSSISIANPKSETEATHAPSSPSAVEVTAAPASTKKTVQFSSAAPSDGGDNSETISKSTLYLTRTTTICPLTLQNAYTATAVHGGQTGAAESSTGVPSVIVSEPAPEGSTIVLPSVNTIIPTGPTEPVAQPSQPSRAAGSSTDKPPVPAPSFTSSSRFIPAPAPAPTFTAPGDSPAPGGDSGSTGSGDSASSSGVPSATTPVVPLFTAGASRLSLGASGLVGAAVIAFLA